MQHHQAGVIGALLTGFGTQISGTLWILVSQGVAGLRKQCIDRWHDQFSELASWQSV